MDDEDLQLLIDLHKDAARQGPGSDAETARALDLARIDRAAPLRVADIGCGTGASTLALARLLPTAEITAVDVLPSFVEVLGARLARAGVADRVTALCRSMDDLPFADEEYDLLWSEGAIYNMGFARGVEQWRRYLRPGGVLAVSEITWTTASRPPEVQTHWEAEYPEIDTAAAKLAVLERHGYAPIGYFVLPESCWEAHYYRPLRDRFAAFLARHAGSERARAIVAAEETEMALYAQYGDCYGYGFYLARRR
ncbi:methyltransferase type 11 [Marichromatium purpuratum 984]|uniref:Methyltransferase type 11 n=1 Tax=Marichromatium purpuratum 984 TaxID=765910 RepID=W0E0H5_MARPU|nr:class I SAM-dependent methyltransferase [Marichromatium purpuratum]AHF04380.1 methyltransferase type 11 [Marichromatium purpuratum 984]